MSLRDQCVAAYKMNELPGHDRIDLTGRGNNLISIFTGRSDETGLFIMGGGSHYVDGAFCRLGFWDRVLTSSEKSDLYNSGNGRLYADMASSLKDSELQAYYDLASTANLSCAAGKGPTLTYSGTPDTVTSPDGSGTAINFNGTNQRLYNPHHKAFIIPALVNTKIGGKKTISFWVKLDAPTPANGSVPYIIGKYNESTAADVEWLVYYRQTTGDLKFWGDQGWATTDPTLCPIPAPTFGTPTAGQWCHIIYEFDLATNYKALIINGTKDSWSNSVVPTIPTILPIGAKFLDSYTFTGTSAGRSAEKSLKCWGSDLNGGHYDHSLFAWIAITTLNPGHNQHILGKFNTTGSVIEWSLDFYTSGNTLYFQVSDGGGSNFYYPSKTISDNLAHSVYCEYEAATKTARISLDNGTFATMSGSFSPAEVASYPFKVGYNEVGTSPSEAAGMQFVGELGPWAKWKRLLTTDERTYLHNLGNTKFYPWDSAVVKSPRLVRAYDLRPAPFTIGGTK